MDSITKQILQKFSTQKVDLANVIELEKNYEIAKGKLSSLENLAARMERDFRKIEDIADKVGVNLNSKTIEAGKFFRDLKNKLK